MIRLRHILLLACLLAPVRGLLADTGQLREVVRANGLNVVVFTAPTPLRAGEVEVVTLVTEEQGGRPVVAYELDVEVRSPDWPAEDPGLLSSGMPDPGTRYAHKAVVVLPEPGSWRLVVEVRVPGFEAVEVPVEVVAGRPHPLWWQLLPWMLLPEPCVGLVVARDGLLRRSRRGAPPRAS